LLSELTGGDAALEHEILARFRSCNSEDAHLLMNAVGKGDLAEALQAAHRMKGASKTIGATGLAAVCERIETASRDGDAQTVIWTMEAFRTEFERLERHIDRLEAPPARAAAAR
jgi:HPt (histidine-containing phosphotransfer) domain-containing protein